MVFGFLLLVLSVFAQAQNALVSTNVQVFNVQGVVREIRAGGQTLVIDHQEISNYMPAMTMPFRVEGTNGSAGLQSGDQITFRLHVTDTRSWIDQITKIGQTNINGRTGEVLTSQPPAARPHHPLLDCVFTNELGRPFRLADFRGEALAITFFFTRCPIPEYCPRLSKNFEEASRKLAALPSAPTNWHFLSITFDPEHDTPAVLHSYAETYHYDSRHWSFVTGPTDKIHELARQSDVTFQADSGLFNHNFRTLIIDAAGHLQMVFPVSGDLSESIVTEVLKAAAVTNRPS